MRAAKELPPQEYLREALDYDPETGKLVWKHRPVHHFNDRCHSAQRRCKWWNARYAGKPAISAEDATRKYFVGAIAGSNVLAHRVIWKWVTGEDALDIDHIDGNGLNNRINNIRSVVASINMKNMKLRKDNVSGCKGVHWFPRTNKWRARIQNDEGTEHHLGYFENLEDAINARGLYELFYGGYLQEKRGA